MTDFSCVAVSQIADARSTAPGIDKTLTLTLKRHTATTVSDHPLTHILREKYPEKPSIGILESSITHALLIGSRFGIITTGTGYKYIYHTDVRNVLGGKSEKFAGLVTTGLGVLELREGDAEKVKKNVKDASRKIAEMGADVIILGCAGMAGMEGVVKEGVREAGLGEVKVVDGAKAGVEFLAGLARLARG
jgi:Asp/Glu/hydantoin racemase